MDSPAPNMVVESDPPANRINPVRDDLIDRIWHGKDPFAGYVKGQFPADPQGWGHNHIFIKSAVETIRPKLVVEIGVWKGMSSIVFAQTMKELGLIGAVVAVDTWLGSTEHWIEAQFFTDLKHEHGQAMLMRTFLENVVDHDVADTIIPMQIDSLNAADIFRHFDVQFDVIHIDAGHDYLSVKGDINAWWPLLRKGGMLVGDDYYHTTHWPGVKKAFDELLCQTPTESSEVAGGKIRIIK